MFHCNLHLLLYLFFLSFSPPSAATVSSVLVRQWFYHLQQWHFYHSESGGVGPLYHQGECWGAKPKLCVRVSLLVLLHQVIKLIKSEVKVAIQQFIQ